MIAAARALPDTLAAGRARPGIVTATLALAAAAWWWTVARAHGMGATMGPGAVGWFTGTWVGMLAAMLLPSFAPTIAAYAMQASRAGRARWLPFTGGYLVVWATAGLIAYGLLDGLVPRPAHDRWFAGGMLALAAAYQLTPLKRAMLTRCHRLTTGQGTDRPARGGRSAALAAGLREGGWCLGCSWALMCALLALGWMTVGWMALIAALVALEKLSPRHDLARTLIAAVLAALAVSPRHDLARTLIAAVLAALAVAVLVAPHAVPGFTIHGVPMQMSGMGTGR